jgi:L-2-hydroxycarboxylate dehydrogenase (NAD+)
VTFFAIGANTQVTAMHIDDVDKDESKKQFDDRIHSSRNTKPAPGTSGAADPSDPEREAEAIRKKKGIPLIKPVVDDLLDNSRKAGIPFELT